MKSKFIIFGLCSLFTMSGYTDGQIGIPLQKINVINPNTNQQNWWKEELVEKHNILEAFWNDRIIKYHKKSVDEFKDFIINGHFPKDLIWQKKIEKLFQDAITQQIKFEQFFDTLKELPQELSLTALIQMNAYEHLIPWEEYEDFTPTINQADLLNIQHYIRNAQLFASLTLGDASEKLVTPKFPENLSQYPFAIHSIGKVFTGVLTLLMIEEGVLTKEDLQHAVQLDAAVIKQLPPAVREQLNKVTLYQLMTHKAGLGDYLGNYFQAISTGNIPVIKQVTDFLPFVENKTFPIGKEHFSNAGILLVGLAIEHAYEKKFNKSVSYNDILQQYIIQKVGMPSFSLSKPKNGKYNLDDPVAPHLVGSPAGGYWTTAEDLDKFGQWVYKKHGSDPAFKTLINKYGQEFYNSDNQTIAHFGAIPSSSAVFSLSLKTGATIAILSNQPLGLASDLNTMIQTHIFSKKLGVHTLGINPSNKMNYLKKPTGQYGVGFDDFYWINQSVCPDFNFNGKNQQDFSPGNTKHCHEVIARIYYPTASQYQLGSLYYRPLIQSAQQDILQQVPTIPKKQLEQLTKIRTFSREKAPLIGDKKFPVLLFSPGFACPAQLYENSITELVSQGYIVVGINTPFINLVKLPNGHIVKPADFQNRKNSDAILRDKFVPLQSQDLIYVYDKLHELHHAKKLFSSMDLKHVGLFGHSIGAWTVAVVAHDHPTWFQAVASLDIGPDKTGQPLKKLKNFTIPVMYQINSIRKLVSPYLPVTYELAHNGYLVGISPNERNDTYSHHMNFTDWSTLQYLPAYATFFEHLKIEQIARGFNLKVMLHPPTTKDIDTFDKITYVLYKQKDTWHFAEYFVDPQHKQLPVQVSFFDINRVDGLSEALPALPNHHIDKLTDVDIEPITKIVTLLNNAMAPVLGIGNGWELTASINTYLVQFFNTYLKDNVNPAFKGCTPLHKDTYIKCGPAQA